MQTIRLTTGERCKVIKFERDENDVTKLVTVGWTDEDGQYWQKDVPTDQILLEQHTAIDI